MSNNYKIILLSISFIILIFATLNLKNFRIDASSDTLVAQNDTDFKYYNNYQKIFPSKNSLVVAIKSKNEINKKLLEEINILSEKISKISQVSSVFNINKAPILFLNETSLMELSKI